jgi:hypothetical protein
VVAVWSLAAAADSVLFTATTDQANVRRVVNVAQSFQRPASSDVVFDVLVSGETGSRMRVTADGAVQVGDRSNFTFGTNLFRRGDGHWGSSVGLGLGGAFSCNGSTPRTKATLPAAATDLATAISLVNSIRTALINNGIGQ